MKNSEQPAYPAPYQNQDGTIDHNIYPGITKREYFAGLAMQGLLANPDPGIISMNEQKIAEFSVKAAKELLKQLEENE